MTTAEAMAVAVLKGDLAAARALADHLLEEYGRGAEDLVPVRKVVADADKIRVALFFPAEAELDYDQTYHAVDNWVTRGHHLLLRGCERMDVYEFP